MRMPVVLSVLCALCALPYCLSAAEGKTSFTKEGAAVTCTCDGNGPGEYVETVPNFTLKDAFGASHRADSLYNEHGMLLMITVPNLTQYERQKRWEKLMKHEGWPSDHAPRCVVLEDLSQQSSYKEKARKLMQDKSHEESRELFLVDEDGSVRRQFGVQQNETVLLLIDNHGNVVHHEMDDADNEDAAARRVSRLVRQFAESIRAATVAVVRTTEVLPEK
jgi:hypothetical protein